jgi:hypothetical protein
MKSGVIGAFSALLLVLSACGDSGNSDEDTTVNGQGGQAGGGQSGSGQSGTSGKGGAGGAGQAGKGGAGQAGKGGAGQGGAGQGGAGQAGKGGAAGQGGAGQAGKGGGGQGGGGASGGAAGKGGSGGGGQGGKAGGAGTGGQAGSAGQGGGGMGGAGGATTCAVDGKTFQDGSANPANPCQTCQVATSSNAWTPVVDGSSCGNGQVCAAGVCGAECFINGVIAAAGAVDPANPCQGCSPGTSTTAWTPFVDGSDCGPGQVCVAGACGAQCFLAGALVAAGAVDPANACQGCNPATATTSWTLLADGTDCGNGQVCGAGTCGSQCFLNGALVAAGTVDPANACQGCSPGTSTTSWTTLANGTSCAAGEICATGQCQAACFVDGALRQSGVFDPGNACRLCDPATSTSAWSPLPDGASCGAGQLCAAGSCAPRCLIDGAFHDGGAVNPANDCQNCDPAASTSAWSVRSDGGSCSGGVCDAGACKAECFIGGALHASGSRNPANDCEACNPGQSPTSWTLLADFTACGTGQYCSANVCQPTWHQATPAGLTGVYNAATVSGANGKIYIFGGANNAGYTKLTQIYDPATETVKLGATTPTNQYRSAGVLGPDGKIYLLGGQEGFTDIANVYAYDPAANTFTARASMPQAGSELSAVTGQNGKIYAFFATGGGLNPYNKAYTQIYDTATNTWSAGAPMPTPRNTGTAVLLSDGRVAVIGGEGGYVPGLISAAVEIYDPATNTWSAGAPMPVGMYDLTGLLRKDGRVVIVSGLSANFAFTSNTYVYDPAANSWVSGLPTSLPHDAGQGARTPDGRLYIISGRVAGGGTPPTTVVDELY